MPPIVISTSLDPYSRSRVLARYAFELLAAKETRPEYIDLAEITPPLPLCDADNAYEHPAVRDIAAQIKAASGVLLAIPVYNFAAGATAKNLVELTGSAWEGKVVAIAAAAGGPNAFMAPMTIATSLMLDFRCLVIPRYVYATPDAFEGPALSDEEMRERMDQLVEELLRVSGALGRSGKSEVGSGK